MVASLIESPFSHFKKATHNKFISLVVITVYVYYGKWEELVVGRLLSATHRKPMISTVYLKEALIL